MVKFLKLVRFNSVRINWSGQPMKVMGIDLSANEKRSSGVCILNGLVAQTFLAKSDEDLVGLAFQFKPKLIAIDAPLSLPKEGGLRPCDRELIRRGIRIFPVNFGAMRELTKRGIGLKLQLERKGFCAIEVFPGGAQDSLRLPRKQKDLTKLIEGLKQIGIEGLRPDATHDEVDAATAALVGWMWLKGFAELISDGQGGGIVMPLPYPLKFMEGIRLYHSGYYWHAHEAWEEVWRTAKEPYRSFLKGLIQTAAALIQAERVKWKGVLSLLNRVQKYLQICPEKVWGLDLTELKAQIDAFKNEVTKLLGGQKSKFNWKLKPRLSPEGMSLPKRERLKRSKKDLPVRAR
ncbi:MAG: DUF309 domain-containing protein [Armatimonadetes bacterium]|nr:DUF309 domain-containing protein [Armatimonadota bacterium]MDW8029519.1 DUF309 domain-containing protein [Armatimonadota bacterium]